MSYLERHNLTDETFVLLAGEATLLIGENAEQIPLEPLKCYNVKAGVWHNIIVPPGTRVPVVENSDTSRNILPISCYLFRRSETAMSA